MFVFQRAFYTHTHTHEHFTCTHSTRTPQFRVYGNTPFYCHFHLGFHTQTIKKKHAIRSLAILKLDALQFQCEWHWSIFYYFCPSVGLAYAIVLHPKPKRLVKRSDKILSVQMICTVFILQTVKKKEKNPPVNSKAKHFLPFVFETKKCRFHAHTIHAPSFVQWLLNCVCTQAYTPNSFICSVTTKKLHVTHIHYTPIPRITTKQ